MNRTSAIQSVLALDTKPLEFWVSLSSLLWGAQFIAEQQYLNSFFGNLANVPVLSMTAFTVPMLANLASLFSVVRCLIKGLDRPRDLQVRYIGSRVLMWSWVVSLGFAISRGCNVWWGLILVLMVCVELWVYLHLSHVSKLREHLKQQLQ